MKYIYYKDDFKVTLEFKDGDTPTPLDNVDFRGKLYTAYDKYREGIPFSRIKGDVIGCDIGEIGSLTIVADNHGFKAGKLMVDMKYYIYDSEYPDGKQTIARTYDLKVWLTTSQALADGERPIEVNAVINVPWEVIVQHVNDVVNKAEATINAALQAAEDADASRQAAETAASQATTSAEMAASAVDKANLAIEDATTAKEAAETATADAIAATEAAKSATAQIPDFAKLIPSALAVEAPQRITLGNLVAQYVVARLEPEDTLPNVLFLSDGKAVSVDQTGRLTVVGEGESVVQVVPTMHTSIAKSVRISVERPTLRLFDTRSKLRLTQSRGLLLN